MLRHTSERIVSHLRHTTPNVLAEIICSWNWRRFAWRMWPKLHVLEHTMQSPKQKKYAAMALITFLIKMIQFRWMYSAQARSFQTSGWPIGHIPVKSIRMLLNKSCGTYWPVKLLLGVIYFVFRAIEFHAISDHRPNWTMGMFVANRTISFRRRFSSEKSHVK